MKHITKDQAEEFKNSDSCYGVSYPLNDPDINAAYIFINGRYPESGRTLNELCKEMVYVIDGEGELFVEGKRYALKRDDVALIDKNEKYYFSGKLTLFVPCTPSWTPEQHKMINK